MNKIFLLLVMILTITSGNSQTDLEKLKIDSDISDLVKGIPTSEKRLDELYGLISYQTEELQNYKFGDISLSKFKIPNAYAYGTNDLYVHVDNYTSNLFLGFTLNIVKEDESKKLLVYLKKVYGNPEIRETGGNGISLFWNATKSKQWIFLTQNKERTRKQDVYLSTKVIVVKQGTRIENSKDSKIFTILDNFNMSYPKTK